MEPWNNLLHKTVGLALLVFVFLLLLLFIIIIIIIIQKDRLHNAVYKLQKMFVTTCDAHKPP